MLCSYTSPRYQVSVYRIIGPLVRLIFIPVFETTAIIKTCKFIVFSAGSFCHIQGVTDEALIAETMVWPNFFLMNVFFALKGFKLFIIISYHCSWMLCRVTAVKCLPALIYSADYILLLVL